MAIKLGRQVKIYIDLNGVGGSGANWALIAQQTGGGLSRSSETADGSNKDDDGWTRGIATRKGWSVSCEGKLSPSDTAYAYLLAQWEAGGFPWIQIDASVAGGSKREGQIVITSIDEEFATDDAWTFSAELTGDGPLTLSP